MRNTLSNISQKKYKKKEYIIIVPNWFGKLYQVGAIIYTEA